VKRIERVLGRAGVKERAFKEMEDVAAAVAEEEGEAGGVGRVQCWARWRGSVEVSENGMLWDGEVESRGEGNSEVGSAGVGSDSVGDVGVGAMGLLGCWLKRNSDEAVVVGGSLARAV
jgi:hypothetical protein